MNLDDGLTLILISAVQVIYFIKHLYLEKLFAALLSNVEKKFHEQAPK